MSAKPTNARLETLLWQTASRRRNLGIPRFDRYLRSQRGQPFAITIQLLSCRRAKKDLCAARCFFDQLHGCPDVPSKLLAPPDRIWVVGMYARRFPFHKLCSHHHEWHAALVNMRKSHSNFVVEFLREPQTRNPDDRVEVGHYCVLKKTEACVNRNRPPECDVEHKSAVSARVVPRVPARSRR